MKKSNWKRGDNPADMPYVTQAYLDNGLDEMKNLLYHEFGHHVHQSLHLDFTDLTSYFNTLSPDQFKRYMGFETKIRDLIDGKLDLSLAIKYPNNTNIQAGIKGREFWAASRYGNSQPVEWFAENFSLWATGGHESLLPQSFLDLIEEFMDHGKEFAFGRKR